MRWITVEMQCLVTAMVEGWGEEKEREKKRGPHVPIQ